MMMGDRLFKELTLMARESAMFDDQREGDMVTVTIVDSLPENELSFEERLHRVEEWEKFVICRDGMRYWDDPEPKWEPGVEAGNEDGTIWVYEEARLTFDQARALAFAILNITGMTDD